MKRALTYDDVLLVPDWSEINSRKEVSLKTSILGTDYTLPVISANMDSVTGAEMCVAMHKAGGIGCLHRFWSIADNLVAFLKVARDTGEIPWVSVGLGESEFERAKTLINFGAKHVVLDVAHGAQKQVADQYARIKLYSIQQYKDIVVIAGNFGSVNSVVQFANYLSSEYSLELQGVKLGVGPGGTCETRVKTGHGYPQWSLIKEVSAKYKGLIIADGGVKVAGDAAKALGAGAHLVMVGSMLSGTDEAPGEIMGVTEKSFGGSRSKASYKDFSKAYKILRGSASAESYKDQGKTQDYITSEGVTVKVPYKGSVVPILKDIEGGLRSALSYSGVRDLDEFRKKAEFVEITHAGIIESSAHVKALK